MKIAVYTICKNEVKFVDRFMEACKDADGVFVLDTGSTDGTVERLQVLGAVVKTQIFNPWRFDAPRNASLSMVPEDYDICISIDLDEILVEGWRQDIEKAWIENTTRLDYLYAWYMNPDNTPQISFHYNKIHSRKGYVWKKPIHETVYPLMNDSEVISTCLKILVEHYPDNDKSRGQYLPLLKLAVDEEPSDERSRYYYGRECFFHRKHEDCIAQLVIYLNLPNSNWFFERAHACIMISKSFAALKDKQQQQRWLLRACSEEPNQREPWIELSDYYRLETNWLGSYFAAKQALNVVVHPKSFLNDPNAWSYKPHDLLGIAAYYVGFKKESYKECFKALEYFISDTRLLGNCFLVQDKPLRKDSFNPIIDIVIISNAKNKAEYDLTKKCLNSLRFVTSSFEINLIVIEQNVMLPSKDFVSVDIYGNDVSLVCAAEDFELLALLRNAKGNISNSPSTYLMITDSKTVLFSENYVENLTHCLKDMDVVTCREIHTSESQSALLPIVSRFGLGSSMVFKKSILQTHPIDVLLPARSSGFDMSLIAEHLHKSGLKIDVVSSARSFKFA